MGRRSSGAPLGGGGALCRDTWLERLKAAAPIGCPLGDHPGCSTPGQKRARVASTTTSPNSPAQESPLEDATNGSGVHCVQPSLSWVWPYPHPSVGGCSPWTFSLRGVGTRGLVPPVALVYKQSNLIVSFCFLIAPKRKTIGILGPKILIERPSTHTDISPFTHRIHSDVFHWPFGTISPPPTQHLFSPLPNIPPPMAGQCRAKTDRDR